MSSLPVELQRPLVFGDRQQIDAVRRLESIADQRPFIVQVVLRDQYQVHAHSAEDAVVKAKKLLAAASISDFSKEFETVDCEEVY